MSFLFGNTGNFPQPPPKPLGVDDKRVSSSEVAKPVPYLFGHARFGATFISDIFEVRTDQVTRDAGKQKSVVGYNYYASFAALICHGPIRGLHSIWFNGEKVWPANTNHSVDPPLPINDDFLDITIDGYGLVRIYKGTETQTPDAYLIGKSGVQHPAYRGLCYAVFNQLFFGFNQTNAPNLEFWVQANTPATAILYDANPVSIFTDLWSNPRAGLGLDGGLLDADQNDTTSQVLHDNQLGVSPLLLTSTEARQVFVQLLEYFNGFAYSTHKGLALDVAQPPANIAALFAVTVDDMSRKPELTPDDWSSENQFTETRVKWFDESHNLKESVQVWRDRGLLEITGEASAQTIDRSWITHPFLARALAAAIGRQAGIPAVHGRLYLRRTAAIEAALTLGVLFRLTYAPRNLVDLVCRVTDLTVGAPGSPELVVGLIVDRSYLFTGVAGGGVHTIVAGQPIAPDPILNCPIVELPLDLWGGASVPASRAPEEGIQLALLVQRPSSTVQGYSIYISRNYAGDWGGPTDADGYDLLTSHNRFALHGELLEDYPDARFTQSIDTTIGIAVQLDGLDQFIDDQTPFDSLADELLVFFPDAAALGDSGLILGDVDIGALGDTAVESGEIMSVHRVEMLDAGRYRLYCARHRVGTAAAPHNAGSEAWIIRRADLQALSHSQFQVRNTVRLKLASSTGQAQQDLADAAIVERILAGRAFEQPAPTNLQVNNSLTPSYTTGADLEITWTLGDMSVGGASVPASRVLLLEFYLGAILKDRIEIPDTITSLTLSNADLIAILGAEASFTLKASARVSADWFTVVSPPITVVVLKI